MAVKSITKQTNGIPFQFIHSDLYDNEIGYIDKSVNLDMDLGDTNDFKAEVNYSVWENQPFNYGEYIFIPGTEFGGKIYSIQSLTKTKKINIKGRTWRGLLAKKVVEPLGSEHLVLNGELNTVIRGLIGNRFGSLFAIPKIPTDVIVSNWKVDRYVVLLDVLNKLLDYYKHKLKIVSVEQTEDTPFHVEISAEPIKDYSNEIEYSGRHYADLDVTVNRGGVNHLVCVGEGQGTERALLNLYVQSDGNIGERQFYFGLDEITDVYKYSSADIDQLRKDGTKRLKELASSKQIKATAREEDVDIGDIIAGYDSITNTSVTVPVVGKILKMSKGIIKIEHRTKGDK